MAYDYKNIPVLSKVKIGEQIYYLKDAEVRAILDNFGSAVTYNVDATVTENGEGLITSGAVHKYVTDYVTDITGGAMTFLGIKQELPASGNPGDVVIVGTAEYVYSDGEWHLYGDEGVYATIQGVEASYVKKTLTIAGINLEDAITAEELKAALGLKALAYKDNASGTIEGVVTGIKDAKYTPAGSVEVVLSQTSTEVASSGKFTPVGQVTGNVTAAGSVSLAEDESGIQIGGSVSAPTVTVTPATAQVQHIASLGELPSYTGYSYTAPSVAETSSQFASEGMVAAIDDKDSELLVISAAGKASALTGTGFNAGNVSFGTFNAGALPSFGEAQTVVTGITSAVASAPIFTGHKYAASFAGSEVAIAANFAGQEGAVSVAGNYDKAGVQSATFAGTEATIAHEVTTGTKSVTVQ